MRPLRFAIAVVLLVGVAAAFATIAHASPTPFRAEPPTTAEAEPSGKLVFEGWLPNARDSYVFAANADGSGLTRLGRGSGPVWSPDGASIAFTRDKRLFVMAADGSAVRQVAELPGVRVSNPVWSPDGSLIVLSGWEPALDESALYLVGVADGAARKLAGGRFRYEATWSPDSRQLAYTRAESTTLTIVDTDGSVVREIPTPSEDRAPWDLAWSPSGDRIAFVAFAQRLTVYVVGVDGLGLTQVASSEGWYGVEEPAWSPDGSRLAFTINDGQTDQLAVVDVDTGGLRRLGASGRGEYWRLAVWSPDGRWLAYYRERYVGTRVFDVWVVTADGHDKRPVTRAFPDGIDYASFTVAPAWSTGAVPEPPTSGPGTFEVAERATLTLRGAAGELAADGARALVLNPDWGCGATFWDERTGRQRRHYPRGADYSLPQEPVLAGAVAAWACAEWDNTFHGLTLNAWQPASGTGRRVAATGYRFPALNVHGDGSLLVYNTGGGAQAKLWRIVGLRRELLLRGRKARPVVDVDRGHIAVRNGASVAIRYPDGRLVRRIPIGREREHRIALTRSNLIVLRDETLELYNVRSGRRVRSWPLDPGGLAPPKLLDADGGFAVYVAGIAIHLVRLSDGKDLALAIDGQADIGGADLEPDGLFYSFNEAYTDPPGRVAFIPMSDLKRGFDAVARD